MSTKRQQVSVVDHIWNISGLVYLSDLRFESAHREIRFALLETPHAQFPLEEWQEAVRYIIGPDAPLPSTSKEAWAALYHHCGGREFV